MLIAYTRTIDTTSDMGISSIKTIGVGMYLVLNINVTVLHVSTIRLGHHQALVNITQVIKILVIEQIRILATDSCVASSPSISS
jgi:hypothetical protein